MNQPAWYTRLLETGCQASDRRVFFVLGCQKSGTTWVQKLLDAHPQVACRGEGHLTDSLLFSLQRCVQAHNQRQRESGRAQENMLVDDRSLLAAGKLLSDQLLAKYIADQPAPEAILAVGDKTPEYAFTAPILIELYPAAHLVHVIRDGRDGAVSGWAHLQRLDQHRKFASFADYAEYFAQSHWVSYISRARAVGAKLPGRYIELRYEDLIANPQPGVKALLSMLGVADDDAAIRQCIERSSFRMLSGREAGEEDRTSHFRKGIIGDWINHFDDEAAERFERHAGTLLDELGYERADALTRA